MVQERSLAILCKDGLKIVFFLEQTVCFKLERSAWDVISGEATAVNSSHSIAHGNTIALEYICVIPVASTFKNF